MTTTNTTTPTMIESALRMMKWWGYDVEKMAYLRVGPPTPRRPEWEESSESWINFPYDIEPYYYYETTHYGDVTVHIWSALNGEKAYTVRPPTPRKYRPRYF